MGKEDVKDRFETIRDEVISDLFAQHISPKVLEEDWDVDGLQRVLLESYGTDIPLKGMIDEGMDVDDILKMIQSGFATSHEAKEKNLGSDTMRTFEKAVMLRALDHHWKEHLAVMDQLRQSVNLRGYGQKNPVQEYKRESFDMFTQLLETINIEIVKALSSVNLEQVSAQQKEIIEERGGQRALSCLKERRLLLEEPPLKYQKEMLRWAGMTHVHVGLAKNTSSVMGNDLTPC
jgi:preprotein translocase subunit SecA